METTKYIWHNGKIVDWHQATTHVLTHGLHYGAGAFEGIRAYETAHGAAVFRLNEHIDRLFYSASVVGMKIPYTADQLSDAVLELLAQNNMQHAYIRPVVYYGYGVMGVNPAKAPVDVAIACWPWGAYIAHECANVRISSYCRLHPASTVAGAKLSGHYLNSMLAVREVKEKNYDEALLLDVNGSIAEGSAENFFMVKDGVLHTPKTGSILPGITRATVMEIARKMKIEVNEGRIRPADAFDADEAFFTGTAAEVSAIGSIDDKKINDGQIGPITRRIKETYLNIVHGRVPEFRHYLSYVDQAGQAKELIKSSLSVEVISESATSPIAK